jgi:hypothetical protein
VLVGTDDTNKVYLEQVLYNMLKVYPHVKARNLDDPAWKHAAIKMRRRGVAAILTRRSKKNES